MTTQFKESLQNAPPLKKSYFTTSADFNQQRSRSLNRNVRNREMQRITTENENMLRRLQEKQSCYNVFDWETDRKKQIKMLKKICYYPPSMVKKNRRSKNRKIDPNYEVYQFYN